MTQQELDNLKKSIEEQGLEYHITDLGKDQVIMIIQKKDPWEGVEFCEVVKEIGNNCHVGQICKLSLLNNCGRKIWVENSFIKPSTEELYIEQLKKTAYEKFGEIKEGQHFKFEDNKVKQMTKDCFWRYYKIIDTLYLNGIILYQQGKWATKIEKVEVEFVDDSWDDYDDYVQIGFIFKLNKKVYAIKKGSGEFLSKQLENYLNNEKQD